MSKTCKTCGAELSENAKFCGKCGTQAGISVNLKTEAGEKADLARKKKKRKRLMAGVAGVVVVVIVLAVLLRTDPVLDMKGIVFDQYGAAEFGNVIESSIPEAKWGAEKLEDKHYTVTVYGFCPDLASNIQLYFDVNYSGDYVYAKPIYGYIDGEYFDDLFSISVVMETLYE